MTEQEKKEILELLEKFCRDNFGNRINEWVAESLLNRVAKQLNKQTIKHHPNNAQIKES